MGYQELLNGESYGTHRGKINSQTQELYSIKLESAQVLRLDNSNPFTPTGDYHPATKIYADQLLVSWHTVYNPQSITADVFDRSKHTGKLDPADIDVSTLNRFVTDVQITNWGQKEDSIGTKGTAFNKSFGTITGTVATGDHSHTKSDIGLSNIDNTSDDNKPVSIAQQAALDLKADSSVTLNNELADFVAQTTTPVHKEGRVFYDNDSHTLSVQSDIPGVVLNIGQEEYIRVVNNSGSTIVNGQACRHDGVNSTVNLPRIQLAKADSILTARVLGIATHDILDGQEGFLTRGGSVNGNFSYLPEGQPVYLSDSVAGGMDDIAPDIVTQLGGVLNASTNGSFMVSLDNTIHLPTLFGVLKGMVSTYILTADATYTNISGFTSGDNVGMVVDSTTGKMTLPNIGWYRGTVTVNITMSASPPSGTDIINIRVFNVTQGTTLSSTTIGITSTSTIGSKSFIEPFYIGSLNDDIVLQVNSADTTETVTFDSISFDVVSESIR